MNKQLLYILSLFILVLAFSSCQSQRAKNKKPIKLMGPTYVLEKMHENKSTFKWFSGKAKVDFIKGKKKTPFTAQVRIKRDSAIWISVSSGIGIEGARLLLTKDSVKYINRIDKTYFIGNYAFLSSLIDTEIDFCMVQALLTANDFSWYDYQNLKAKLDNQRYQLESTNRHKLKKQSKMLSFDNPVYYQSLWINSTTFKIERIKIKEIGKENKKIFASYRQYKSVNEQLIPYSIDIDMDNEIKTSLEMVYYKINLDKEVGFPFSISKKYSPIEL
jgi:hypothetical protein